MEQQRRHDDQHERNTAGGPGAGGAGANITRAQHLLAVMDEAIGQALSGNAEAFNEQVEQENAQ